MARMRGTWLTLGSFLLGASLLSAQTPSPPEFEVVSIKRSPSDARGASMGTAPDGTFTMRNLPIRSIVSAGSLVPTREVEGVPDWVARDTYDIIAKPPAGSTRPQWTQMMRRMLEDRFKLKGHVEERERTMFALVLARSDGRLGPQLTPSTLDCATATPDQSQPRCGSRFGPGAQLVSDGVDMNRFAAEIVGMAGGLVINRTGLQGSYSLTVRWAPRRALNDEPHPDDPPDFVTAIQDQLGLKLQPQKAKLPVFVVDSIERPSDN